MRGFNAPLSSEIREIPSIKLFRLKMTAVLYEEGIFKPASDECCMLASQGLEVGVLWILNEFLDFSQKSNR